MTDIKALELAYVRIQVPDLGEAERFFAAFGLPTQVETTDRLYARGTGPDHHLIVAHRGEQRLLATAYELRSEADLARASRLPDASPIRPIDGPGGGWRVMLTDLDGNGVELVHGVAKIEPIEVPKQEFNFAAVRDRRRNAVIRPDRGRSHVVQILKGARIVSATCRSRFRTSTTSTSFMRQCERLDFATCGVSAAMSKAARSSIIGSIRSG